MLVLLRVVNSKSNVRQLRLQSRTTVIGRGAGCQLKVVSDKISRRHCQIVVHDNWVTIQDLGSANGTFVNGHQIPAKMEMPLAPGTKVAIGSLQFFVDYELPGTAAAAAWPSMMANGLPFNVDALPKAPSTGQAEQEPIPQFFEAADTVQLPAIRFAPQIKPIVPPVSSPHVTATLQQQASQVTPATTAIPHASVVQNVSPANASTTDNVGTFPPAHAALAALFTDEARDAASPAADPPVEVPNAPHVEAPLIHASHEPVASTVKQGVPAANTLNDDLLLAAIEAEIEATATATPSPQVSDSNEFEWTQFNSFPFDPDSDASEGTESVALPRATAAVASEPIAAVPKAKAIPAPAPANVIARESANADRGANGPELRGTGTQRTTDKPAMQSADSIELVVGGPRKPGAMENRTARPALVQILGAGKSKPVPAAHPNETKSTQPSPNLQPSAIPRVGHLLGIDRGTNRTGFAVCNADQTIASLIESDKQHEPVDTQRILRIISEYNIVGLVIGMPLANGNESPRSLDCRNLADWLTQVTRLPVTFADERSSSRIAAQVTLQCYLDGRRSEKSKAAPNARIRPHN